MKCPNCGKKLKKDVCKKCGYTPVEETNAQPTVSSAVANAKFYMRDDSGASYSLQVSGEALPNPALDVMTSLPTCAPRVISANKQAKTTTVDALDRKLYIAAGWLLVLYPIVSMLASVLSMMMIGYRGGFFAAFARYLGAMGWNEYLSFGSMAILGILCFIKANQSSSDLSIIMGVLLSILACSLLLDSIGYILSLILDYRTYFSDYILGMYRILSVAESVCMAVIFFRGRSGKGSYVPAILEIVQTVLLIVYYSIAATYFRISLVVSLLVNVMMVAIWFLLGKAYKEE